jgi:ubiquinone/menaquinone biosynthesis C-methylase UbiE
MDYDQTEIASVYDEARQVVPETLRQWLDLLAMHVDAGRLSIVVDLGCGTGRFSGALAAAFDARVVAVDPSLTMLKQARAKLAGGDVVLVRGSATGLPVADGGADLVFMSMVYHHLDDPAVVARECGRIVRSGGHVAIRNTTRDCDYPHRHFFPGQQRLIDALLPSSDDVVDNFSTAGFAPVAHEIVTQVTAPDWASFVRKSALRADSFLARLPDKEFDEGMAALAAYHTDGPVYEECGWFVFEK